MVSMAVDTFDHFLCHLFCILSVHGMALAFQGEKVALNGNFQQQALWDKDRQKRPVHISSFREHRQSRCLFFQLAFVRPLFAFIFSFRITTFCGPSHVLTGHTSGSAAHSLRNGTCSLGVRGLEFAFYSFTVITDWESSSYETAF